MHPGGILEFIAEIVGLAFVAIGVSAIGQWLREGIDRMFGAQLRHQFPDERP